MTNTETRAAWLLLRIFFDGEPVLDHHLTHSETELARELIDRGFLRLRARPAYRCAAFDLTPDGEIMVARMVEVSAPLLSAPKVG